MGTFPRCRDRDQARYDGYCLADSVVAISQVFIDNNCAHDVRKTSDGLCTRLYILMSKAN